MKLTVASMSDGMVEGEQGDEQCGCKKSRDGDPAAHGET
jgi:hypothetical protein